MKASRRSKRMTRHHKRTKLTASLNMVSLMDIFTILVFFLLVSSSSVQDIPNSKKIKLPESIAETLPKETVVIIVGDGNILVQGRKIALISDVINSKSLEILPLKKELIRLAARRFKSKTADGKELPREVTIMGDKKIPFKLLKKIMLTCARANYGNISLAVIRQGKG